MKYKEYKEMDYNVLRSLAAERNLNMGRNPKKRDLVEALEEEEMSEKKERRNSTIRGAVYALLVLVLAAVVIYLVVERRQLKNQTQEALALNQKAVEQNAKLNDQNTELLEELEQQQDNTQTETEPATGAVSTECPTTAEAKELTGVDVQRLGTEPCAWVWRAVPEASTPATCPDGWVCTWDLGGQVAVYNGYAKSGLVAGTWRMVKPYPEDDAVNDPCALLAKEQEFGASETPSFEVTAGNFECSD